MTTTTTTGPPWQDPSERIHYRISKDDVDLTLTDFPVTIHLDGKTAVFNELITAHRKRIKVTTDPAGDNQCYVEIEYWDSDNDKATLHVKVPTVSHLTDTDLYFWYDSWASPNTTYVGDTGDAVAQNVWDSDFEVVYHMNQDPENNSADDIIDSTSNENHGTPTGFGSGTLVAGKSGRCIDFDGVDARITTKAATHQAANPHTAEVLFMNENLPVSAGYDCIFAQKDSGGTGRNMLYLLENGGECHLANYYQASVNEGAFDIQQDTWYFASITFQGWSSLIHLNDALDMWTGNDGETNNGQMVVGSVKGEASNYWDGKICEVRVSSTTRSKTWQSLTYKSLFNTLLTEIDDTATTTTAPPETTTTTVPPVTPGYPLSLKIENPGAEEYLNDFGWTKGSQSGDVRYSSDPNPYAGDLYFFGGRSATGDLTQEIDLDAYGVDLDDVDTGELVFELIWRQSAWAAQDQAQMKLTFKNSGKSEIDSIDNEMQTTPTQVWRENRLRFLIPADTRYVDIRINFNRVSGTNSDGYIDAVQATIWHQSHWESWKTDFSEYSGGSLPSDWTERFDASGDITVEAAASQLSYGGKVLRCDDVNVDQGCSWNDVGNLQDFDILIRVRQRTANGDTMGIMGRGSGGAGSENFITLWHDDVNHTLGIGGRNAGSWFTLEETGLNRFQPGTGGTNWVWIRFRVMGSTLWAKFWLDGYPEPDWETGSNYVKDASWNVEAAGWTGIWTLDDCEYDFISISEGGAVPAPYPDDYCPDMADNWVNDEFTGDDDDPPDENLWQVTQNDGDIMSIQSNKLNINASGSGDKTARALSRWFFDDGEDFDITIDFDITTLDDPATSVQYAAVLQIENLDGSLVGQISRARSSTTNGYSSSSTADSWSITADAHASGKLRLIRTGSIVKAMYYDPYSTGDGDEWQWSTTQGGRTFSDDFSGQLRVHLWAKQENNENLVSNMDNFRSWLNGERVSKSSTTTTAPPVPTTTTTAPPPCWADDDFTGDDDSPPSSDWEIESGAPTIQSNKLSFDDGDRVRLRSLISGDFDIQIDFDISAAPSTNSWGFQLRFRIEAGVYEMYSSVAFFSSVKYYQRGYVDGGSWYYSSEVRSSTSTGKLRIVRDGSTFHAYYDDGGGWNEIVSGANVDEGDGVLILNMATWDTNPTVEGVTFDDLFFAEGCPSAITTTTGPPVTTTTAPPITTTTTAPPPPEGLDVPVVFIVS
jgi:hypothetical protein